MFRVTFFSKYRNWLAGAALAVSSAVAAAQDAAVFVNRAPNVNGGGLIDGSVQQMTGENATLNGQAAIEGDWIVPGAPKLKTNGNVTFGGLIAGTGSEAPSGYQITLNGGAKLGHLVTRTDPVALPVVAAPPNPTGTRSVTINQPGQSIGERASLLHLTLNANAGDVVVPPGSYGRFSAGSGSGLVLGVAGTRSFYSLQELTFNSQSKLVLAGPVVLTISGNLNVNAHSLLGAADHPEWLTIRMSGQVNVNLNSHSTVHGMLVAPKASVIVNAQSKLRGLLYCDRLTVNGQGVIEQAIAVNKAPVAIAGEDQSIRLPATAALSGSATDDGLPAGAALSYSWSKVSGPGTVTFIDATSAQTTASFAEPGTYLLRLTVSDTESSGADEVTVVVLAANQPPVVDAGTDALIHDPGSVTLSGSATDDGVPGSALTYAWSKVSGPGSVSFADAASAQTTAVFAETGSYVLKFAASDGELSGEDQLQVVVNALPSVSITAPQEGSVFVEGTQIAIAAEASDDNRIAKVEVYAGKVGELRVKIGELTAAPYTLAWIVPETGHWQIEVRATDSLGGVTVSDLLNILAKPANEPPVANDQAIAVDEDGSVSFVLDASDPNGDGLVYEILTAPARGVLSGDEPNLTYAPEPNQNGSDSFTYQVTDPSGLSDTATVSIAIRAINDPPTVALSSPASGTLVDVGDAVSITATTADIDGTIAKVEFYAGETKIGEATAEPWSIEWQSLAGTHSLKAIATDNENATAEASAVTLYANAAPVVEAGEVQMIQEDGTASLSGTATDDGLPQGVSLAFAWTKASGPGTVSFADAAANTTATFSAPGSYVLRLTVSDSRLSGADEVTVAVNGAPVLGSNSFSVNEDEALNLTLAATDPENETLSFAILMQPQHGTLTGDAPNLSYRPAANYHGSDSFTFRVTDLHGGSVEGTAALTVASVNDAPSISIIEPASGIEIARNESLRIVAIANDTEGALSKVQLIVDGQLVAEKASGPYEFDWTADREGVFTITTIAIDQEEAVRVSEAISITVVRSGPPIRTVTQEMVSGNAAVGALDPKTEVWDDKAWVHPVAFDPNYFGALPGAKPIYIYSGPRGYRAYTFRRKFALPHQYANVALDVSVFADNVAVVYINGRPVFNQQFTDLADNFTGVPKTVRLDAAELFRAGENSLEIELFNTYSTTHLNYRAVLTYDAPLSVENEAPQLEAGADRLVRAGESLFLNPSIVDDAIPSPAAITWAVKSAPQNGGVDFDVDGAGAGTATFSQEGGYVLAATISDGEFTIEDTVAVRVLSPRSAGNLPPVVDAGADVTVIPELDLLRNGNAEMSDSADNFPYWESTFGRPWLRPSPGVGRFPAAQEGNSYF